ncbi:MAG: DegT/DnrJ/EryC1/StrS family aminotransferase [Nitrospira sp.]|jgi:dTDP-4-amino-4,6-dideoxygalactose transaminase|nr:DegT/DnrJ/EryC1/StrS family aminotransferase [Nitrospira sp.]
MNIPLLDLKAQFQPLRAEIMAAVHTVCDEQGFILGPRVVAFEEAVAKYTGARYAISCASGSDALLLSLMAMGVGHGDEVITVPFTFFATAGAISRLGAKPVFIDIQRDIFNLDPAQLERAITPRTKAIIPVHLFGQCADMDAINRIARAHKIPVIEDACQAIGAWQGGKRAGVLGETACFSFFPSKNLGGFGDGGMITTNDQALADSLSMLRVHGSRVRYLHEAIGINSRLDALQAVVLHIKLKYLDQWAEGRRRNAARYEQLFKDAGLLDRVTLPATRPGNFHVYNQYTVRVSKRDELRAYLKDKGVGTEIYYPLPMHLQQCYQDLGHRTGAFPESERAAAEVLSLPVFAELSEAQLAYVAEMIAGFYKGQ